MIDQDAGLLTVDMYLLIPMENYEGVDEYSPIDLGMMVNSR